ncbi:MAG: DUF1932 domain-containing protein [Streptosporangiales bacterium]|nr:DUF1932 domain-containing protein [Streptosporangiales bacterium]
MSVLTLLHPGQMGAAVGAQARGGERPDEVLWLPEGRSEASKRRAADAGLSERADLATALAECDVVLSICPPAAADEVARGVAWAAAATRFEGLYVEGNAIAPERAGRIRDTLAAAGVRTVDGGIIGPPPQGPGTTRLYLSGDAGDVTEAAAAFAGTDLETVALDGPVGAASGMKLAYASYQKVSRLLGAVSHALAREHGVQAHLEHEAELLNSRPLAETDVFSSAAAKAWRWGPEMAEAADALRTAGLPGDLAEAASLVFERWESAKDRTDLTLDEVLRLLRDTD